MSLWLPLLFVLSQLILSLLALSYSPDYPRGVPLGEYLSVARYLLPRFLGWGLVFSLLYALARGVWVRRITGAVLLRIILGLFVYEYYLLRMYHILYNDTIADIMLSTNGREGMEYLRSLWGSRDLLMILLALVGLVGLARLLSFVTAYLEHYWSRWTRPAFALSLLLMIFGIASLQRSGWEQYHSRLTISTVRSSTVERLIWETKLALLRQTEIAQALGRMQESFAGIELQVEDSPFQRPVHVVLILGESTTTRYMHGYGYPLPTTPRLDSLEALGEVLRFHDVVSPAASTINSNTRSLTYYTMERGAEAWYEYPTLLGALRKAGYYTAWMTAQDAMGMHSMVNTFGRSADTLRGTPGTIPEQIGDYYGQDLPPRRDAQLLDILMQLRDVPQGRGVRGLFQVLHLMGCHELYRERYPESFARFSPSDLPQRRGGEQDKYIAEYLNAVYYNDYVVTQLMERLKGEPLLLFYFSDHGEVVYNDPEQPDFKGRSSKRVGVSIPFYAYMSPSLRAQHPELWAAMSAAVDKPYETDLFTHTLTGLLGIKTKYSEPRYELFSPAYDVARPRLIYSYDGRNLPLSH